MSKNNHIINSFVAGEISPKAFGRTDTAQYNSGCEDTLNSIIYPQGGFGKRPGTQFILEPKYSDNSGTIPGGGLYPFFGSNGKRYQIFIGAAGPGDGTRSGFIAIPGSGVESVKYIHATPAISSSYLPAPTDMHFAQSGDTMFFAHAQMRPFKIVYDAVADTFSTRPYPDFDQALTVVDLWRQMPFLSPVIGKTAPYTAGLTLTVDGSGNAILSPGAGSTITFDGTFLNRYLKLTYGTSVVVVQVTAFNGSTSLTVKKMAGTMPANSTATLFAQANTDNFYEEGYWDSKKGWPRTVTFFETRIVFGGSQTFPDMMWFSQTDNIDRMDQRGIVTDTNYAAPVATTIPFSITLKSNVINRINWMSAGKNITVGTNFREFVVQGPSDAKSIGSDNIQTEAQSAHGSAYNMPARLESVVVFLHRSRNQIRELTYNLSEDAWQAANLNILSEHVATKSAFKNRQPYDALSLYDKTGCIQQIVMQEAPNGILWARDTNGSLWGLTRERQQQVSAWHYHELGGPGLAVDVSTGSVYSRPPKVVHLSALQSQDQYDQTSGVVDDLWMVVERYQPVTSGGITTYTRRLFIEKMAQDWNQGSISNAGGAANGIGDSGPPKQPIYLDCATMTYGQAMATPVGIIPTTLYGIGDTVSAVIDGVYYGEFTVAQQGAYIGISVPTLTNKKFTSVIGYKYSNYVVPVVPEAQAQLGSSLGQMRRVDQITVHFYRTIAAKFGRVSPAYEAVTPIDDMEEFVFDQTKIDQFGTSFTDFFTGDKRSTFPPGYETRPKIKIQNDYPLPMQVTHIIARMVVYE